MIVDFLKTNRSPEDLRTALAVLREFKGAHSRLERFAPSFVVWVKLDQFEEFLDHLVTGASLRPDTLENIETVKVWRETKTAWETSNEPEPKKEGGQ